MERLEVIQRIIDRVEAKTYLEIGVRYGTVLLPLKAPRKIGVDPHFRISFLKRMYYLKDILKNSFYGKTSDDFFRENVDLFEKGKIDVAFIDGLHTYKQSLADVENCLKYLSDRGVIVMHDSNPTSEAMAEPSYEKFRHIQGGGKAWYGDVWKTIAHLRSTRNDLNVFVLDADCGLGIITRGRPESRLSLNARDIERLSYKDLEADRTNILNLKDPAYLDEFLKTL